MTFLTHSDYRSKFRFKRKCEQTENVSKGSPTVKLTTISENLLMYCL